MVNVDTGAAERTPLDAVVSELAPRVQDVLDEMDRERRVPADLMQFMARAGFFRVWMPRSLGGREDDPATMVRLIEETSATDGSVGWSLMISGMYSLFAGCLPPRAAKEIYGTDPNVISAGTFRPNGQAVTVDGGFRISGQWPLASNCMNANWLIGGARILDGDRPRMTESGAPVYRIFFFPVDRCAIVDTWRSAGLHGTGSHDFTVDDLFVPFDHSLSFREPAVEQGPLYALPIVALFSTGISAVSLGIARHAISILEDLAGAKMPT